MSVPAYDWIAHHARYAPGKLAAVDLHSGRRFSYAEFDDRIRRAALFLRDSLDVTRGDRVAVLCHNATDMLEMQFACRRLGAIHLPLNWRLAAPELDFICTDAAPKGLIHGTEFAETAREVGRSSRIPHLVSVAQGAASDYEQGLAAAADGKLAPAELSLDDTWIVMYTSGTTGRPKGAQITYGMMFFNAVNCAMLTQLTSDSIGLTVLPLFHIGGLNLYANPLFHIGGASYVMRAFDAAECLRLLSDREIGITHAFGVPTNFLFMSQLPAFGDADLRHVVSLGVGGAAAPLSLLEAYAQKGIILQQGWGMTETATLGTFLSKEVALEKVGSSGLPVMHTALRIVDEAGRDVSPGETGELLIKGPTVTPGYWNRPEANAAGFTDGWLHTGDAAQQDADGHYYIVDRWKDMYISGGENVYPAEVENVIFQLDGVAETAVIGVSDEKWGEVGRAFVVPKPDAGLTAEAIRQHCLDRLARYKVPASVVFLDELPHNATGKVTKHLLPRD